MPHSWLWGHIPILLRIRRAYPGDAHLLRYLQRWVLDNLDSVFPDQKSCPPVVYIDLWPVARPLLLITHHAVSSQIAYLPKSPELRAYLTPLDANKSLISTEGDMWRTWRTRFNPGFSLKNVVTMVPFILEESLIFVDGLRSMAGQDGAWGPVFPLEERTTNLTFDIIGRVVL